MCWAGKTPLSLFLTVIFAASWISCRDETPEYLIQIGDQRFITRDELDYAVHKAREGNPAITQDVVLNSLADQVIKSILLYREGLDTTTSFRDRSRQVERDLVNNLVGEQLHVSPYISSHNLQRIRSHMLEETELIFLVKKFKLDDAGSRDSARHEIHRLNEKLTVENFERMVWKYSDEIDLRTRAGSMRPLSIRYGQAPLVLESAIIDLDIGMLTPPIEFPQAFVIAKVVGRKPVTTFSDFRLPTNAELIQDLTDRIFRDNRTLIAQYEADYKDSLKKHMKLVRQLDLFDTLVAHLLNGVGMRGDQRVVATVGTRDLTLQDFIRDHETIQFTNEDLVHRLFEKWLENWLVFESNVDAIKRSLAFKTSWRLHIQNQYNWKPFQFPQSDRKIFEDYFKQNVAKYFNPGTVTLNELYVTHPEGRDSIIQRLRQGQRLMTIAQELNKRRMTGVNYVPNREITELQRSIVFRKAMDMQPMETQMVALGDDRYAFIELVSKKDRRPLSYDEAASRVRSDWTSEQRRLDFLKAKARLAVQYPIVIHDVE